MKSKELILDVYFQTNESYAIRHEELDGKQYIVVPVTMMVEGVHSGSHGPVLHLAEELGRYPESWDGMPVTIGHPRVGAQYVSANSPDVLSDWAVGRIFNTYMDGTALRAEAWCCIADLERVSEDTLDRINNGEIIEVSIGVFSDEEETSGTWNTENYIAIARNHRPNHLALLPDEIGACSIEDGCGIRVNKKGGSEVKAKSLILNSENQSQILKELNQNGFSVNELGHSELSQKIGHAVYGLDGNGLDNYVEEIYGDYFVYAQYNNRVEPRMRKLYKQAYKVNAADEIELDGEAIHVKREITYANVPDVVTNGRVKTKRIIQKNKKVMANENCTDCVKKLVDNLIANKALAFSEDDREMLESLREDQLEKMTPQPAPQVNEKKFSRADVLSVLSEQPLTTEEYLQIISPEAAAPIVEGLELRTNQKTSMVTEIMANSDVWTEDELNLKELDELKKIHKVATNGSVHIGGGNLGGSTKLETNSKKPKTIMLPKIAQK
jgi:hypothetical protein